MGSVATGFGDSNAAAADDDDDNDNDDNDGDEDDDRDNGDIEDNYHDGIGDDDGEFLNLATITMVMAVM